MKLKELLEKNCIEKISDTEYKCLKCEEVFCKFGIINHHLYNHEEKGNEIRKKISEKTKEAFQRPEVQKNFQKFVDRIKIERRGKGNPMYGKTHTEEWKKKHSEDMTGFEMPEEAKEKLRQANTGKKHKPESIITMRNAKLGKKDSPETKLKKSKAAIGHTRTKLTCQKIKKKYPFFYKIEKPRENEKRRN